MQKKGSSSGASVASPMIKSTKGWIRERRKLAQLELHTFPLGGSLCFIFEFLLDFRKDNLVILMIRSLFSYQGLVIPYRGLMFLRRMRFGHWEIRG